MLNFLIKSLLEKALVQKVKKSKEIFQLSVSRLLTGSKHTLLLDVASWNHSDKIFLKLETNISNILLIFYIHLHDWKPAQMSFIDDGQLFGSQLN